MSLRSRASLLALPALVLGALAGPLAAPSSAALSTCAAVAEPPHLIPNKDGIHATGTFACAEASTGMTVTVCIEELNLQILSTNWRQLGCATATVTGAASNTVSGEVVVPMMIYSTFLRATVLGVNDNGDSAAGKSAPAPWVNCACAVG